MPRVTFIQPDGAEQSVEIPVGRSMMEGARDGGVSGIDADCGGACSCATCHVRIAPEWLVRVGTAGLLEDELLDGAAAGRDQYSRLSCQVTIVPELDGVVAHVPDTQ